MAEAPWQVLVDVIRHHIVRISTPRGSGTGFLLYSSKAKGFTAIATAAHVINASHLWEEPIRLERGEKSAMIRASERAILIEVDKDVAAIAFQTEDLDLPEEPLSLSSGDMFIRVGVKIGWLGFPAIARELCFFSGRVSAYIHSEERYLVDGVAINGVSGGPAFCAEQDGTVSLMGVLSAYIPNKASGVTLPGLAVVTDVVEFHKMAANFKSFEEVQSQQTPPTSTAPIPVDEPPPSNQGPASTA